MFFKKNNNKTQGNENHAPEWAGCTACIHGEDHVCRALRHYSPSVSPSTHGNPTLPSVLREQTAPLRSGGRLVKQGGQTLHRCVDAARAYQSEAKRSPVGSAEKNTPEKEEFLRSRSFSVPVPILLRDLATSLRFKYGKH